MFDIFLLVKEISSSLSPQVELLRCEVLGLHREKEKKSGMEWSGVEQWFKWKSFGHYNWPLVDRGGDTGKQPGMLTGRHHRMKDEMGVGRQTPARVSATRGWGLLYLPLGASFLKPAPRQWRGPL